MKQQKGSRGRGDEIYQKLAYNRKNSLRTHPRNEAELTTHNLEACISILEVIAHVEGEGGEGYRLTDSK